jgi:hypothetical protein
VLFLRAGHKLEKLVSILSVAGHSGYMLIYSQHFDKNKNKTKNCQQAKFPFTRVPKFKLHVINMYDANMVKQ